MAEERHPRCTALYITDSAQFQEPEDILVGVHVNVLMGMLVLPPPPPLLLLPGIDEQRTWISNASIIRDVTPTVAITAYKNAILTFTVRIATLIVTTLVDRSIRDNIEEASSTHAIRA